MKSRSAESSQKSHTKLIPGYALAFKLVLETTVGSFSLPTIALHP